MISGLPAPWPVAFDMRMGFVLVMRISSTSATSESLKYHSATSTLRAAASMLKSAERCPCVIYRSVAATSCGGAGGGVPCAHARPALNVSAIHPTIATTRQTCFRMTLSLSEHRAARVRKLLRNLRPAESRCQARPRVDPDAADVIDAGYQRSCHEALLPRTGHRRARPSFDRR